MFNCCLVMQYLVLSSFAIISLRSRKLVALLWLCSCCHVAVSSEMNSILECSWNYEYFGSLAK